MEGMVKMVNRLINMNIAPIKEVKSILVKPMQNGTFTIQEYAKAFIDGMSEAQKARFKKMLENGIKCGLSVADNYGIDYDEFIEEVKKQMEVK